MARKPEEKNSPVSQEIQENRISRRNFLKGTGAAGIAVAAAASGLTSCKPRTEESVNGTAPTEAAARDASEPLIPVKTTAPEKTEMECEVLVIGGGFAGLNAAVSAKKNGASVILVDKGYPGFSGLSPFASSHRWFDKDLGDKEEAYKQAVQMGGDYITNLGWYQKWIDHSKETFERLMDWEVLTQFPRASDAGDYVENKDYQGYFQKFIGNDRRLKFSKVLKDNNIEYIPHTMIKEVVTQEGKVSGAMGFHVPSGAVMTFHAKSVIMAMGGGSYKPTGYPVGGNTFDGEYIGYKLGLPIIGKEFDDFHLTCSYAAGNAFENNNWTYLENIWLCGGDVTPETAKGYAIGKGRGLVLGRVNSVMKPLAVSDGSKVEDLTNVEPSRRGATLSGIASDIRTGKNNDPMPKGDVYGAAVGMSSHLSAGIFCGIDDTTGYTGIPGLYVSGDGICGSAAGGAAYANGVGFTSNFCSTQGWITGKEAAGYASGTMISRISSENKKKYSDEILAPMQKEGGLSPAWARDLLQTYMAPYWVHIAKDETSLKSTLTQIEYMRDNVLPQLSASNTHELRLCHEMESKILCAEMKLRASMERKESRGYHYRTDYPARDDKNFLCYMGVQKGDNGEMQISRIEVKDEWKGDVNAPYTARYLWQFPGDPNEKKSSRG